MRVEVIDRTAYLIFEQEDYCYWAEDQYKSLHKSLHKIKELQADGRVESLLCYSKAREGLLAGILYFSADWQQLFAEIEDLDLKTVVRVHGRQGGAAMEFISAFQEIECAHENEGKTFFQMENLSLGLGLFMGGTWRLSQKLGLEKLLWTYISGEKISPTTMLKWGLVNRVLPLVHIEQQVPLLNNQRERHYWQALQKIQRDNFIARGFVLTAAKEQILQTKDYQSYHKSEIAYKFLKAIEESLGGKREDFFAREQSLLQELLAGSETQNLLFLQQHQILRRQASTSGKKHFFKRAGIMGVGVVGSGVAWLLAKKGLRPVLADENQCSLEQGFFKIAQQADREVNKDLLSEMAAHELRRAMLPDLSSDHHLFAVCDIVIESVPENLPLKKDILRSLEMSLQESAILLSNTTSLSISEMAKVLKRPQNFAGLQFFRPVAENPLVEVVVHDKISANTREKVLAFARDLGRVPIVVKDGPGFVVGRLLMPYFNEAIYLLNEGVSVENIDKAATDFGMRVGPLRLMDELGLDLVVTVARVFQEAFGVRSLLNVLSDSMVANKMLGRKSGRGFYVYGTPPISTSKLPQHLLWGIVKKTVADPRARLRDWQQQTVLKTNPLMKNIFPRLETSAASGGLGLGLKSGMSLMADNRGLQMRLLLPMINESTQIVHDGLVEKLADIDLAAVLGAGFPDWKGGPLRYADHEGPARILTLLQEFEEKVDSGRFHPSSLLIEMAKEEGSRFYGNEQEKTF